MTKIVWKFNSTTGRNINLGVLISETEKFYIYDDQGEQKKVSKKVARVVVRDAGE